MLSDMQLYSQEARPKMYACLCMRDHGWVWPYGCEYVSVCHLPSLVNNYLCICMYMHINTAKRLHLHKAVILLLIMKYFVLKIASHFHTTTQCNLINKQSANSPIQKKITHRTHSLIASQAPKADAWYKHYNR